MDQSMSGAPTDPAAPEGAPLTAEQHMIQHLRQARLEALVGTVHGRAPHLPAWLRQTPGERRFAVASTVLLIIVLQLSMARELAPQPRWLLPALEVVLFLGLTVSSPVRINRESMVLRSAGFALLAIAAAGTAYSAGRLVFLLAHGRDNGDVVHKPMPLLINGGAIWLMNIIVFALAYWEFDRGGPAARANARKPHPDFLFTQMAAPELTSRDWEPAFLDYLYLSFTNATAFSPTDTLPLSRWAKLTMMAQSAISLVTVALVVARAVNIFT